MTRHLAKLLDAIWYLSMGLFLGLTGGMVLSVILTFRGAREIDAAPGVEPFNDPMFAEYHNEAVAGYIGQDLFMVGGTVALVLLGIAFMTRIIHLLILRKAICTGSNKFQWIQIVALVICLLMMSISASNTVYMNKFWPMLYDTDATINVLKDRRIIFENLHVRSERFTRNAWLLGLLALSISPWCRRVADEPSETESNTKA